MFRCRTRLAALPVLIALACSCILSVDSAVEAEEKIVLKIGTLAPKDTPWYDALAHAAEEWKKVSNGQVEVKIFEGGTLGNEVQMVGQMRQGRLHGAMITSIGVREIEPSLLAMQLPRVVTSYDELEYCMAALTPLVKQRLEEKGFIVLHVGDSGWVRFFTKKEVKSVEEMKKQRLFVGAGDQGSVDAWNRAGFSIVQISQSDITPSLQTGLLDGLITPPLAALAAQWFGSAPNMLDYKWAPLVGAIVLSKKQWERIDPALRPKLLEIAERMGKEQTPKIRKMEDESIVTMKKYGLKIRVPSVDEAKAYENSATSEYSHVRGSLVPADAFDVVMKAREEFRKTHPAAAQ